MVGLPVLSHQSGPIHAQHHMEVVNGHIVDQHIVGPLEKGGVHSKHGYRPLLGHSGCHGNGAAFGDPNVKEPVREGPGKFLQAGAPHHSGCQAAYLRVLPSHLSEFSAEHSREIVAAHLFHQAGHGIKGPNSMEGIRILLSGQIPLSLDGPHMEQDRLIQFPGILKNPGQLWQVMPVYRTKIGKSHILKHTARQKALLQRLLDPVGKLVYPLPHPGLPHDAAVVFLKGQVLGL